jgi:hypothetical protein
MLFVFDGRRKQASEAAATVHADVPAARFIMLPQSIIVLIRILIIVSSGTRKTEIRMLATHYSKLRINIPGFALSRHYY